jgi:hypothetical protein
VTSGGGDLIQSETDNISTKVVELPENLSVLCRSMMFVLRKLFSRSVAKAAPTWKINSCKRRNGIEAGGLGTL